MWMERNWEGTLGSRSKSVWEREGESLRKCVLSCEMRPLSVVWGARRLHCQWGGWGEQSLTLFPSHTHMYALTRLTNSPNAAFTPVWCHGFHPEGQWVPPFMSTCRSDAAKSLFWSRCPCATLILTMFSLLTFVGMQAVDWWAIPPPRSWEPFWPVAWVHPLLTHHTLPGRPPRPPHPLSGADPTPAPRKSGSPIRTKVPQNSHAHTCPQLHPRLWPHCLEEIYSCLGRIWDRSFPGCIVTLILCIFRPC